jgi:hypothetical protein
MPVIRSYRKVAWLDDGVAAIPLVTIGQCTSKRRRRNF